MQYAAVVPDGNRSGGSAPPAALLRRLPGALAVSAFAGVTRDARFAIGSGVSRSDSRIASS